jgi:hypothetical protein
MVRTADFKLLLSLERVKCVCKWACRGMQEFSMESNLASFQLLRIPVLLTINARGRFTTIKALHEAGNPLVRKNLLHIRTPGGVVRRSSNRRSDPARNIPRYGNILSPKFFGHTDDPHQNRDPSELPFSDPRLVRRFSFGRDSIDHVRIRFPIL